MKSIVVLCLALLAVASAQTEQSNKANVGQFFKGVVLGFEHKAIPDLDTCIQDVETVVKDVEGAVADFRKKTYDGVKDAIRLLGDALERLADAMTRCKASAEEVEKVVKVIAQLKNPKQFFYMVGKNILLNGKEIFAETNTAFTAWSAGQFEQSGEAVGAIVSKMLGTGVEVARADADVKIIAQMFLGILQGFEHQAIPSLDECIKDVAVAVQAFEAAFRDFEKGTWDSVKQALKELGTGLDILADAMSTCKAVPADVAKVLNALKQLKNPKTFFFTIGKNLLINGKEIYSEIVASHDAWKNQQYFVSGQNIGYIVKTLLLGEKSISMVETDPTVKKIEQLFAGIVMGFEKRALPDLDTCITDITVAFGDFYAAFKDFEKKTYDGVKDALKEIGAGLNVLADAMDSCKAAPEDIKKLIAIIKTLSNPKSFIFTIGRNLIVNGKDIFSEATEAFDDWKADNFYGSGLQIGYIISKLLGTGVEVAIINDQPVDCSSASAHLKISKMSFTPDPPVKGQNVHIIAAGNLDEQITNGNIHLVAKYLGIKVVDTNMDLCKTMEQAGQKCPVGPAPLSLDITQALPSSIPSGSYDVQVQATEQNGQELTCIKLKFKI